MRVAIIGTRQPSPELRVLCESVAEAFRDTGCRLVTGNSDGVEGIAVEVWNRRFPERVTLVLPWPNYNRWRIHPLNSVVTFDGQPDWAESVARRYPHLSLGAFMLYARSYGIAEMTDALIALPGERAGGDVGHGIFSAERMGKPLFVLPADLDALREYYRGLRRQLPARGSASRKKEMVSLGRAPSPR